MNTTEKWHADIHVTNELVKKCLREQFPSLGPIELKQIGEGWDNKVYLVNEKIIFRFPRRKISAGLIENENIILNNLPKFSDIDVPIPKYLGYPTDDYPYAFQGYEMIPGIPGYQAKLSPKDRATSITTLANFLKQLHSIDENKALAMGAKPQIFDRMIVAKSITTLTERIDKILIRKICHIDKNNFQQEIKKIQTLTLSEEKCLVHGDLDCRHLLFKQKKLTGIIDWGDVGINNKAIDLAILWIFYPSSCHPKFFEIYGAVDAMTWEYARFLGLYYAFTLLLYGNDINDVLLVKESINAIKRINVNLFS